MDGPPTEVAARLASTLPALGVAHRDGYLHLLHQQDGRSKRPSPLRGSCDSHNSPPGVRPPSAGHGGSGHGGGRVRRLQIPDSSLDFEQTVTRDLPPSLRGTVGDNKMLTDEVRRYRHRMREQEQALAAQERQLVQLRDEVLHLQAALHRCSVSPADLMRDEGYRQELAQRDAALQQLAHRAAVLEHAKEVAERRMHVDLSHAERQQQRLQWEIAHLQQLCQDKDKQARLDTVHMHSRHQRVEAVAGPPMPELPTPQLLPAAAEAAEPEVRLMLCILREEVGPTAAQLEKAAARLVAAEAARQEQAHQRQHAAARTIQAAARAMLDRRRVARQHRAIVLLQAHVRGMLARRRSAALRRSGGGLSGSPGPHMGRRGLSAADRLSERCKQALASHAKRALLSKQQQGKRKAPPQRGSVARQAQRAGNMPETVARLLHRPGGHAGDPRGGNFLPKLPGQWG